MPARHERATTVEALVSTPLLNELFGPRGTNENGQNAPLPTGSEVETEKVYSHPMRVLR